MQYQGAPNYPFANTPAAMGNYPMSADLSMGSALKNQPAPMSPQGEAPMPPGMNPQIAQAAMQAAGQQGGQGQPTGTSKALIGALQQMHNAIGMTQDPAEVNALRGLIQILTRLIQRDQMAAMVSQQGGPMGAQQPQMPQGMMGGSPMGQPTPTKPASGPGLIPYATGQANQGAYSSPSPLG